MKKGDFFRIQTMHSLCDSIINPPEGAYDRIGYLKSSLLEVGREADRLADAFKDATRNEVMWGLVRILSPSMNRSDFVFDEQTILEICKHDIAALKHFCERVLDRQRDSKEHKRSKDNMSR